MDDGDEDDYLGNGDENNDYGDLYECNSPTQRNDRICTKGDETYYLSYSSNMFNQVEYPTSAKQGNSWQQLLQVSSRALNI